MTLSDLGFNDLQERLYRALLDRSDPTLIELQRLTGVGETALRSTLTGLVELGVLRADPASQLGVGLVSPAAALGGLIERAEDDLLRTQRRLGHTRAELAELAARYAGSPGPTEADAGDGDVIERVAPLDRVREKLEELSFFTAVTLRAVQPGGPQSEAALDASRPLDRRGLRRGVDMRIIYQISVLDDATNRAYLAEITAAGAQVRVTDQALERMIVMDSRIGMVPIDPADSRRGAYVVRQPGLVLGLGRLFDRLWADAEPLPDRDGEQAGTPLTELDRRVIALLAAGSTDESAARTVGVSVRHLRRRIARLMTLLGATSRFEAGVRAAKSGWI